MKWFRNMLMVVRSRRTWEKCDVLKDRHEKKI